jgi:hypothetical protein
MTVNWETYDEVAHVRSTHLSISARKVRDFNTSNHHNYKATLSLEEIAQLLEKLGDVASKGGSGATLLVAALSPKLAPLLRLAALCCLHTSGKK